ncbi:MAG: methylmalonyl-CoA mutase family protein [Planctomycetota bacterium]
MTVAENSRATSAVGESGQHSLGTELDIAGRFGPVNYETWRERVEADLKGAPFDRRLTSRLYEGITLQPIYTDRDWPHAEAASGFAGASPMTRGAGVLGHTQLGWDTRQEQRGPTPGVLNGQILDDLQHGVTSVLLRLDMAGRRGLDADDASASQFVGRDGAAIGTLDDLDAAFEGVHLNMIGVALEAGAAFAPAAGLVSALWERRGRDGGEVRGAFNADPLAVLARDGGLPMSLDAAMAGAARLASETAQAWPGVTSIRVGTAPYHHAGATATQDLAFSMASGVAYLRAMLAAGMDVESASKQMVFSFALGCNQFLGAAKLRAARKLWARVIEACGGGEDARRMSIHTRVSKRVLAHRDPWVNMLRNTSACFAAVVGGADAITSTPFDDALGPATPLTRRIARNTSLILQDESHLHRVSDPAGGSYFIESLTDELAERAWAVFQQIEGLGGMAEALVSGWVLEQIAGSAEQRDRNIATRRDAVLGVSEFSNPAEVLPRGEAPSHAEVLGETRSRLLAFRRARGDVAEISATSLGEFTKAASAGATIGELSRAAGLGKGEASLAAPIQSHPYAAAFEELRGAADRFAETAGYRPGVHLVCIGAVREHGARAGFSRSLFEAGGFAVSVSDGFEDVDAATEDFASSGATVAVICSTDDRYAGVVDVLATKLHAAGARTVVLAGAPGDREAAYRGSGVDRFIYVKCDAVAILRDLLTEEGVL